ncbi:uncharacterized protein PG986_012235 [Apiospora aurea]|uniref:Uncharacterized protein n=1 Tax=Apiospora aurea TaxID=335848 RepID=A0ABR1PZF1_9PEZI
MAFAAGVLPTLSASRDRHARRLTALHLTHGAGAAEDRGARQLGLRGRGDADGLAVDHVALVLAPDVGARDVAAAGEVAVAVAVAVAVGEDGVRDGAEGGGEEEEGLHDGSHWGRFVLDGCVCLGSLGGNCGLSWEDWLLVKNEEGGSMMFNTSFHVQNRGSAGLLYTSVDSTFDT